MLALLAICAMLMASIIAGHWALYTTPDVTRQLADTSRVQLPPPSREARGSANPPAVGGESASVEVAGLIKLEIGESNSWQTIAKIMTLILGTFLGMRAINALFDRIERRKKPVLISQKD